MNESDLEESERCGNIQWALAILSVVLFGLVVTMCNAEAADLPNPKYTPGVANPKVTQGNISKTICVPGFTKTIRPPANYTNLLKKKQLSSYYKSQGKNPSFVEEDHLIALTVGGDPRSPRNLWPQFRKGHSAHPAEQKDLCELATGKAICAGDITLNEGQQGLAVNWIKFCSERGWMK